MPGFSAYKKNIDARDLSQMYSEGATEQELQQAWETRGPGARRTRRPPPRRQPRVTQRTLIEKRLAESRTPQQKSAYLQQLREQDRLQRLREEQSEVVTEAQVDDLSLPTKEITSWNDIQDRIKSIKSLQQKIRDSDVDEFIVNGETVSKAELLIMLEDQVESLGMITSDDYNKFYKNIDLETGEPKWEQIPVKEWKFYPNSDRQFSNYASSYQTKRELLNEAYGSGFVKITFQKMVNQLNILGLSAVEPEGSIDFTERVLKRRDQILKDKSYQSAIQADKYTTKEEKAILLATIDILWDDLKDKESYEKYYGKLHPVERFIKSLSKSGAQFTVGILTFPEMIVETLIGRDIIPLRETIESRLSQTGGTPGLISTITSGAVGAVTGDTSGYEYQAEQIEKYPTEAYFATLGEIAGLWAGSKVATGVKTTLLRGAYNVYSPLSIKFPKLQKLGAYTPTQLARTGYAKIKTKLGLAEAVPEEQVWNPAVLRGETKYSLAPGRTPSQRIQSSIRYAERARYGRFTEQGYYPFIHATPGKLGRFGKFEVTGSASESPMLSMSVPPYGSPEYLKVGWKPPSYGSQLSWIPKIRLSRPTAPIIYFKRIAQFPKKVLRGSADDVYKATAKYMEGRPVGSTAYVAPKMYLGGSELEFSFWKSGKAIKIPGKQLYTTYKGRVVPLPKFQAVEATTAGATDISKVVTGSGYFTYSAQYGSPLKYSPLSSYIKSIPSIASYSKSNYSYPSYSSISSIKSISSPASSKPSYPSRPSYPSYPTYPYRRAKKSKKVPIVISSKIKRPKPQQAYNAYVDNKRVTSSPVSKDYALAYAGDIVDKTQATKFSVRKTKGIPTKTVAYRKPWKDIKYKFDKRNSTYYEKKKYQKDFDIERGVYVAQKPEKPRQDTKKQFFSIIPLGGKK